MTVVALVISVVALVISYFACRHAARSADASEATYRASISCRVIAEVRVERGRNRPVLAASGKADAYDIEYTLIAEYLGGEEKTVSGARTALAPHTDTTIEEIPPGNCIGIRGIITWKDSSGAPWSACRSKAGTWVVVQREHSVESLPN